MGIVIKVAVWLVILICGMNISFSMMSQASTMENIVGFFILIILILVSYKTKCLTKFKRKHEK